MAPPSTGQRVLRTGALVARTYVEYNQGVVEGLVGSVKSTWGFVTKDAWDVKTWTEMGTTMVAVSLMSPQHAGTAQWLDGKLGTQFAPRQVQIVMALDQTFKEMPHWKARQWGQLVGRVAGDVLTTKGAGAGAKAGVTLARAEFTTVRAITRSAGSIPKGLGAYGRYSSVRAQIPFRNVTTPPNRATFWSGLEEGANEAKEWARLNGRTSLEMTKGGQWLDGQQALLNSSKVPWDIMRPQWARLSRRFAQATRGQVTVLQGPRYNPVSSIWVTVEQSELQALQKAGKVTEIKIVKQSKFATVPAK
ncbi:hypothetical protein [Hymenobacter psychrotolerans]|uniref:Uncharacterized protein n=1 Tax=Hymenobacter psychrotolerans DSM 18569 TaxID=1121959 RepID=A0A1M7FGH8_9BACT|nr:hypothetical protein [Hymenobacter psychrotolerans]SHM03096.1 hypothetical protein SAMN02746009_03834 [Hymenobacter psychrotolerans DSM 18569]